MKYFAKESSCRINCHARVVKVKNGRS